MSEKEEIKQSSAQVFFNGLVKEKSYLCTDAWYVSYIGGYNFSSQWSWHGINYHSSIST